MATHSSILAWRIPWAELDTSDFTFTFTIFYNDRKVRFLLVFPEGTYMKFKCLRQPSPHQPAHFLNKKGLQTSIWNQKLDVMCLLLSVVIGHTQCQSNRTQVLALHTECSCVLNIIQQLKSIYAEVLNHCTSLASHLF